MNGSETGGSTISFGAGSFSTEIYGSAPRIGFALWALAFATSTVVGTAVATVFLS